MDLLRNENFLFIVYNAGNLLAFLAFWPPSILHLRLLMGGSMLLLSLYFWLIPGGPLANALFWMFPQFIINMIMIAFIYREKRAHLIPESQRLLFDKLQVLTPGQFKTLASKATQFNGTDEAILVSGTSPTHLHFLLKGQALIYKQGKSATVTAGTFLGEIAFINGGNATATVTLPRGSESIAWKHQELKSLMQKDGAIDIAMRGIFNRDLATKVASSIPISN